MHALKTASGGDANLEASLIAKILPNRNAQRMGYMFGAPEFLDQIAKDKALQRQAMGSDAAYAQYINNDPKGVQAAFSAQYKSMIEAIGSPIMQAAIPVMKTITDLFGKIGAAANASPGAITAMAQGVTALGAALVGGGAVGIVNFCLGLSGVVVGWPIALAAGVVAGVTALAVMNWGAIKTGAEMAWTGVNKVIDAIEWFDLKLISIGKKIWDFVTTLGGLLNKTSFGGGFGGGGGITNAAWYGGGGELPAAADIAARARLAVGAILAVS